MSWTTYILPVALVVFVGYGLWCGADTIRNAIDDIWRVLGW